MMKGHQLVINRTILTAFATPHGRHSGCRMLFIMSAFYSRLGPILYDHETSWNDFHVRVYYDHGMLRI
jgi:hypothetical protein